MYGLSVIDQILCLFCWNYKNFSKLTNTSPKWRHLWNLYLGQINAPKVCITSVCVFISSLCMAWMLSIKYFVFFTQILRFSLNWRTNLQNGVILWNLYLRQINASKVCITWVCIFFSSLCMAWMLSIKYFVIFTQISRFSLNWRTHLQNDVILWNLYLPQSQCH